jgi:hypothetical protein
VKQYRQLPYVRKGPRVEITMDSLRAGFKMPYVTGRQLRRLPLQNERLLREYRDTWIDPFIKCPKVAPSAKPVPGNR